MIFRKIPLIVNILYRLLVDDNDEATSLDFDNQLDDKRRYDLPNTITDVVECNLSNNAKPECKELGKFPTAGHVSLNPKDL